ncbi:unnamed protein product [Zymoseptoria tritici ST99CH_1A5]|uniref:RNase H type-1 domain-containing protein n=1 Tax=Zymoseptoria tritici ST99CH_1A5 TaxID=1276529 RepID=A0A1Y6LSX8_ZYMTR|nr:unnamed protein product [Zymoseptoria tritici ST99CH_1A5]
MSLQQQQQQQQPSRTRQFFVDGSAKFRFDDGALFGGSSSRTWVNGAWLGVATSAGECFGTKDELSLEAEVFAIYSALEFAVGFAHEVDTIVVISDCKFAISDIERPHMAARYGRNVELVEDICAQIPQFEYQGIEVRFEWVRSHLPIIPQYYWAEGNRVADAMATRICELGMEPEAEGCAWSEVMWLEPETHGEGACFDRHFHQS